MSSLQDLINKDIDERIDISIYKTKKTEVLVKNCEEKCKKCNSKNVHVMSKQTRSADEGTTLFFTCLDCGYVWRRNG